MSRVRQQELGVDIGGVLALALLASVFYFQSLVPWMQLDQANQAQRRQFLSLRQRAAAASSQVRSLTRQLEMERNALPASTVTREDVRQLNSRLARIAALASKLGLQLRNIEPGRPSAEGERVVLPIHLAGFVDYRGCAEFLHAMRAEFSDTSVYSLQMTAKPDGEKMAVDLDLNLRWYAASATASVQN
jgi:Tfp pilus assembly protein PilO